MAALWFLSGVAFTVTAIILLLPWLRTVPGLASLPALPWPFGAAAVLTMSAVVGACLLLGRADPPIGPQAPASSESAGKMAAGAADSWAGIEKALGGGIGPAAARPTTQAGAQPMARAIAALQSRLSKGGGSADDWELLAKSYEFLGRPADASKARGHQLPALLADDTGGLPANAPRTATAAPAGAVRGQVSLSSSLKAQAVAGATLFIVAKSVDSPGAPVAVYRTTVGSWPLQFQLSDSESMLPGRNLSNAGRVTIEARISRSGQPLPAAGDLQGASGVVEPADRRPLEILIDKVVE